MKDCYYCHCAPEMKWEECMNFGHKALGYYVVCPNHCLLEGVYDTPTKAADAWDRRIAAIPGYEAKSKERDRQATRWAIAHGYRFWHIVGPDGFKFDLWLKSKPNVMTEDALITEDMRSIYCGRGYNQIKIADFSCTDITERESEVA